MFSVFVRHEFIKEMDMRARFIFLPGFYLEQDNLNKG